MEIMIAGLGLIGGSMAKSLNRAGFSVDGFDREEVVDFAFALRQSYDCRGGARYICA